MNLDIASLFPDLEPLTPDGRWNMLQDWLAKNPEYDKHVDRWSRSSVNEVFQDIQGLVSMKYGIWVAAMLGSAAIEPKLRTTIEILQACYRERAGECKAEYSSGWIEPENDQRPSAHKSIHDYQQQLKAKKRRRKK
jgi:hypothetical protein